MAQYRQTLAIVEHATYPETLAFRVLAYNNLAYHLHLMGEASAIDYVQTGLQFAIDNGILVPSRICTRRWARFCWRAATSMARRRSNT